MASMSADVVIVGGGIVGVATAYLLGRAGVKSVVVERDSVGSHASGFAYGLLSRPRGPGPLVPLLDEAWRIHKEFAKALPDETGVNIEFRLRPTLTMAFNEEEAKQLKEGLPWRQREAGPKVQWVDEKEAKAIEPRINPEIIGGVHSEGGGEVEPYRLVLALVQAAEKVGATIRHGSVVGLRSEGGRVNRVVLENDEIACENVVLAMGPWSSEASSWLNMPVPVTPLKGQILRLQAPGAPFQCALNWSGNYATSKPDGLLWAGTTEEDEGFNDTPTTEARDKIMASLLKMVPSMTEARLAQHTACLRPLSADGLLLLGKAPGWEGVYLATGAGRQGIMLGPAMARITVDLITKGATDLPIADFDPARFAAKQ